MPCKGYFWAILGATGCNQVQNGYRMGAAPSNAPAGSFTASGRYSFLTAAESGLILPLEHLGNRCNAPLNNIIGVSDTPHTLPAAQAAAAVGSSSPGGRYFGKV